MMPISLGRSVIQHFAGGQTHAHLVADPNAIDVGFLDIAADPEVDFSGVPTIGHGFADELFRVFAGQQPALELMPVNMSPAIATLIERVRRS